MGGIFWGVVAALGWGHADFMAQGVSVRLGAYRALLYAHVISFGLLLPIVIREARIRPLDWRLLLVVLLLGGLNTLASVLLYRALEIGQVAVVSPIGSSYGAVTLALSLLSGDQISSGKLAGLGLTLVGVVVAAMPPADKSQQAKHHRGVWEAVGGAVAFGVTFWGLKYVVSLGPWIPVFGSRLMSIIFLPLFAGPLKQTVSPPQGKVWWILVLMAVLDTGANAAYNAGLRSDAPGVVAVLGSLFSPITVLLAFVLLRERLSPRQWFGVATIFVAVACVGIAQGAS